MFSQLPTLGVGIGYRAEIADDTLANAWAVDWLEVITEHYIQTTSERAVRGRQLREQFPLVPHGIEMSIGTEGEVDDAYLDELAAFVAAVQAPWFSDHLCFTRAGGIALGQLTPLHRTRDAASAIGKKAKYVQDRVGVPFLLENISYYVSLDAELTEAEFITEVIETGDCGLLLDLANVFINSVNHGFDARDFLDQLPLERVVQVHIAGGTWSGRTLLDAHGAPVHDEVWDLLEYAVERCPLKGVLLERDQNFPSDFSHLASELERARLVLGVPTRR